MDILTALDDTSKLKKYFRTSTGLVDESRVRKLPKVEIKQVQRSPAECVGLISSCYQTADPIGCTIERLGDYLTCISTGQETLVVGVPCKGETVGTHSLPYSVYQDWLNCVHEGSGGEAECDTFTITDELNRKITTKISCECPHDKMWNGSMCGCPDDKPYDEADMIASGGRMFGDCCAPKLCGEGGDYFCETDVCECNPSWFDDGANGCTNNPCSPGVGGGTGCPEGLCCQTIGNCVLNVGNWDSQGDQTTPKMIEECERREGRWITTNDGVCPELGHCELSVCELSRSYVENEFVISECDPNCIAEKCDLACKTADPSKCGGEWIFNSCDNTGTPSHCLCACKPP